MHRNTDEHNRSDPYQDVTDRILAALEAGTKPWIRPWDPRPGGGSTGPLQSHHRQTLSRHQRSYPSPPIRAPLQPAIPAGRRISRRERRAGRSAKGEKSATIFFYKPLEIEDDEAKDGTRTIPMLKAYHVFHASQIDGIPPYIPPTPEEAPWQRPEAADIIMRNSGAVLRIGGGRAFYSPSTDHIQLPPEEAFAGPLRMGGRCLA